MGCIFAELIIGKPLFPTKVEMEQLEAIFKVTYAQNPYSMVEGFAPDVLAVERICGPVEM